MPHNRLTPWRFVLAFGVVSMLADLVYESARAITGPYLATLGAGAAVVGLAWLAGGAVTGALYDAAPAALPWFVLAAQAAALLAFLPLVRSRRS